MDLERYMEKKENEKIEFEIRYPAWVSKGILKSDKVVE